MKTFIGNGDPRAFVRSALKQRTPREPDDNDNETEKPPIADLPYVAGVSERIGKVCRDFNIRTVFKSRPIHRGIVTKVKDPLPTIERRLRSNMYPRYSVHWRNEAPARDTSEGA